MSGGMFWRNDTGYERARRSAVSNGRKPDRFPDVIVRAQRNGDVVAAVQLAKERGLKIGIRSGGHSWAASFLRDGGMLLDLSQMNGFSVDVSTRTATIQPGLKGADLNRALLKDRLFCPATGSRPGSRACNGHQFAVGVDDVHAEDATAGRPPQARVPAEAVHANESENADLFWAARGSGPGFFGVVTRFHLGLQARPHSMMKSDYVYPIEVLDDVLGWIRTIQPSLPLNMEPLVFVRRNMFGHPGPAALVTAPVMADSQEEARAALALLETCPVLGKAVMREVDIVTELDGLLQGAEDLLYPQGAHYAADNMWTNASADALIPGMRKIAATLPPAPSHMMWMLWGPTQPRPDMSFSMESDLYIALYGISRDAAGEAASQAWVTERMRELEHLADGIQLADENLGARPFRFLADSNFRRLQAIRSERDPNGVFHSYMGLPRK
jgi:FAD/FMN-containing dehydrogenase